MHWEVLVTVDTHRAPDNREARRLVVETLADDPTFLDDDDRGGVCDWFVVGGRSSGTLAAVRARRQPAPDRVLGHDSDAELVDELLYNALLHDYAGQPKGYLGGDLVFLDLEGDAVTPHFIGQKWLVVLDCHS